MFRLRRYRVVLICAFMITVLLYHVSKNSQWDPAHDIWHAKIDTHPDPRPRPPQSPSKPEAEQQHEGRPPHEDAPNEEPAVKIPTLKTSDATEASYGLPTMAPGTMPDRRPPSAHGAHGKDGDRGNAGMPFAGLTPTTTTVHWEKPTEWFPVPEESLIMLPTGKPKPIRSVQFAFGEESPAAREKRERRLEKVKAEAQRAWTGYKTYAWTHDELMPVSNSSKDPFCGWAATLVDSLDTLWIMGLKDEFDEAVEAVRDIDFTTTPYREDIPVFETVIRYLGGLIGAYDVAGGHESKYRVLLDKAVELAEILMSAFDTPNRMPILYYNWKPANNVNPKRASTSVSVAELGSLSMEFTRLAQLTGKNKYYDAVARITDALEELQNREGGTAIPGIFPENLDASGCNRTASMLSSRDSSSGGAGDADLWHEPPGYESWSNRRPAPDGEDGQTAEPNRQRGAQTETESDSGLRGGLQKRWPPPSTGAECVPQGLVGSGYGMGSYSMGGSQDSAYEYFPKQYVLLGGLEEKYRTMHEKVADAVKKHLLFRPMAEGDPDVLFSAKVFGSHGAEQKMSYEWEVTHLTCFLGGMFGLGGKLFDRPEDVEVGKRLTDGCVWAYDVMPTGIMPEYATVVPCKDPNNCRWNQTAWYEALDPMANSREAQMEDYYVKKAEWRKKVEELKQQGLFQEQAEEQTRKEEVRPGLYNRDSVHGQDAARPGQDTVGSKVDEEKVKELEKSLDINANSGYERDSTRHEDRHGNTPGQKPISETSLPPEPVKPLTHQEYVAQRIQKEHIPPGFVTMRDKRYILR